MQDFEFPVENKGAIVSIDLGRPEEGNALTRGMMVILTEAIRKAAALEETRLVVVKARGAQFCRGRDGRGEGTYASPYERRVKAMGAVLGVYDAIAASPVPVVALVQGPAIGFGAALAGACDITLSTDAATYSFPELLHDIPPTMAMAAVLRNVPFKALSYLIYSGDSISASEAVQQGLVSKIFKEAEFAASAEAFLQKLATRDRVLLATVKKFQSLATGERQELVSEYAGTLLALMRS